MESYRYFFEVKPGSWSLPDFTRHVVPPGKRSRTQQKLYSHGTFRPLLRRIIRKEEPFSEATKEMVDHALQLDEDMSRKAERSKNAKKLRIVAKCAVPPIYSPGIHQEPFKLHDEKPRVSELDSDDAHAHTIGASLQQPEDEDPSAITSHSRYVHDENLGLPKLCRDNDCSRDSEISFFDPGDDPDPHSDAPTRILSSDAASSCAGESSPEIPPVDVSLRLASFGDDGVWKGLWKKIHNVYQSDAAGFGACLKIGLVDFDDPQMKEWKNRAPRFPEPPMILSSELLTWETNALENCREYPLRYLGDQWRHDDLWSFIYRIFTVVPRVSSRQKGNMWELYDSKHDIPVAYYISIATDNTGEELHQVCRKVFQEKRLHHLKQNGLIIFAIAFVADHVHMYKYFHLSEFFVGMQKHKERISASALPRVLEYMRQLKEQAEKSIEAFDAEFGGNACW